MQRYSIDKIRELTGLRHNIRNISVIAHVDHGKSTLTDSLLTKAGLLNEHKTGEARAMDTRKDEQLRAITIKATGVSMAFELPEEDQKRARELHPGCAPEAGILVNLIDSPGHVDFSSEVTAALRVTDGALVVVDCVEGVCVQTETVLRQGLAERVRPVLVINKLDRALQELKLGKEELYQRLQAVIAEVNGVIATYQDPAMGDLRVSPERGTVAFACGLQGWGFTLAQFARRYAHRFGVDSARLQERLWGEHYYSPATRRWASTPGPAEAGEGAEGAEGALPERGFNRFVLEPIYHLFQEVMVERRAYPELAGHLAKIGVALEGEEREQTDKRLLKTIMRRFLPAGDALVELIALHLPSPPEAQRYRAELLYEGPLDDPCAEAIRACDPEGPLMVFVSKMVPSEQGGRFYAFGRVFSGTVRAGMQVRIQGPRYRPGAREDLFEKPVQRTLLMMGRFVEALDECPAGGIVGLVGIDQYLLKSGTLTTFEGAHNIKAMKFSVAPVVRVSVEARNAADLPRLVEGLKRLSKSDPLCQVSTLETGEHVIAAAGELHLEIVLQDLEQEYAQVPLRVSEPVVSYRETVTAPSPRPCMSKSASRHNRFHITAAPMAPALLAAIEAGDVSAAQEPRARARALAEDHGWDPNLARKLWCFGPDGSQPNLLLDATTSIQYMHEVRDSCVAAFQWATKQGVLCEEPMRGCEFRIVDATLHSDTIHRGAGQVIPTCRRAVYGSFLMGQPTLQEPVYLAEIQCPSSTIGGIHQVLSRRRGHIFSEEHREGNPLVTVKAYLPVRESFQFTTALRAATGGQAFPQLIFDHWQPMGPDLLASTGVIEATRLRKGLSPAPPPLEHFFDRL